MNKILFSKKCGKCYIGYGNRCKDRDVENELLHLAYEELLDLRGYLCNSYGKFDPDYEKLEKYWNQNKPEWEKKLNNL